MRPALLVLIVDEQEDTRQLLARQLFAEGSVVSHASTAGEALCIIRQQRPDMVVAPDSLAGTLAELARADRTCPSCRMIGPGELAPPTSDVGCQIRFVGHSEDLISCLRALRQVQQQGPETD